jgi:hypothetical protein
VSIKRKIILIPYWVEEVLRRKQLPLATCLDFQKLRPVLALSDLVAFVALQDCWGQLTGEKEPGTNGALVLHWFLQLPASARDANQDLSNNVLPLAADPSVRKDLQARLFEGSARMEHAKEPFISYDLTPEFAGAVIYPGFFGKDVAGDGGLRGEFVKAMLKVLYVYEPHNEVAKTPLFHRYLSLLAAPLNRQ